MESPNPLSIHHSITSKSPSHVADSQAAGNPKEAAVAAIAASTISAPKPQEAPRSLKSHRWKLWPESDVNKAIFRAVRRVFTWMQSGIRKIVTMELKGQGQGLQGANVGGSFVGLAFSSYVFVARLSQAYHFIQDGKYGDAAKSVASAIGAAASIIGNLSAGLGSLAKLGVHTVVIHLGVIGGTVCAGLGPLISSIRELLRITEFHTKEKELLAELKELKKNPDRNKIEIEKRELLLSVTVDKKRMAALRMLGALAFAALQIALAVGSGGISVGIMLGITLGYLAFSYTLDIITAIRAEKQQQELDLKLKALQSEIAMA